MKEKEGHVTGMEQKEGHAPETVCGERVTEALQFDGKNVQDVFKLPCVSSIYKKEIANGTWLVWVNVFVTVKGRCRIEAAFTGDWICKMESGEWRVVNACEKLKV